MLFRTVQNPQSGRKLHAPLRITSWSQTEPHVLADKYLQLSHPGIPPQCWHFKPTMPLEPKPKPGLCFQGSIPRGLAQKPSSFRTTH